jgi:hypothetical protein
MHPFFCSSLESQTIPQVWLVLLGVLYSLQCYPQLNSPKSLNYYEVDPFFFILWAHAPVSGGGLTNLALVLLLYV